MPRVKKFFDRMLVWLPKGTFARIDAVLGPTEDRADFVRGAVEHALKRRERGAAADPLAKHLAPPTARERAVRGAGRAG
jgi:hypothetical protein